MKKLKSGISKIERLKDKMVVHFEWGFLPIPQMYSYVGDPLYDAYVAFTGG